MITRATVVALTLALTVGDYLMISLFGLGLTAYLLLALHIQRQLAQLLRLSKETLMDERTLQQTLDDIKSLVGDVATRMTGQANQIAVLQEQQASGVPVTQEQLDGLGKEASEIKSLLAALTGSAAPPAAAPADVPPAASSPDAGSTPGESTEPPVAPV